jgi:SanA protein
MIWSVATFILLVLALLLLCNLLVVHNAKGKVFSELDSIKSQKYGLLLGTTPKTRIGNRANQFYNNRIIAAENLYKAGKVKNILISGSDNSKEGVNEVESMKDSLIARGVNANDIILDGKGYRTLDSVVRTVKVFDIHSFVVISQKFHNERAIYQAEHLGLDVHDIIGYNAADATSNTAFITYLREYLARVKLFIDLITNKKPLSLEPYN